MLTPVDLQNKVFKGGIGFDKKDVEAFMHELSSDYEQLYRSNVELNDKVATLNESLQHYKSVEDSMQKALTLSEKTAEETVNAANDKARQITTEAEKKAESILADAKQELTDTKNEIFRLQQQQKKFKEQFTHVLQSQLKMMDGEIIDIDLGPDFEPASSYDPGFGNFSGAGLGSEGGLGSGLGGGYVGNNGSNFERTNQDPSFDRGTLNMDPFADAMNGGGRFSRQTGGAYNGNSSKKNSTNKNDSNKSSLNMKQEKPNAKRMKRTPVQTDATVKQAPDKKQDTPKVSTEQNVSANSENKAKETETKKRPTFRQVAPTQAEAIYNKEKVSTQSSDAFHDTVADATETANNVDTIGTVSNDSMHSTPDTEPTVSGEVEDKINESTMLDSEDNYSDGFDFVEEDSSSTEYATSASEDFFSDEPVSGEVENKVNESTMLDSEDNYSDGFDFMEEDDDSLNEETYSGEVEDKINESTMLDSEDNYNDGFDFLVGNEEDEEIPTILGDSSLNNTTGSFQDTSLNIDPFGQTASVENEDVLSGDVEDKINESNLIGNEDDDSEGFNFL